MYRQLRPGHENRVPLIAPRLLTLSKTRRIPMVQLGLIMPNRITLKTAITTLPRTMRHSPAFDIVAAMPNAA
jgi:hypothetical protein